MQLLTVTKNLDRKDKITLKMKELTDTQQLQELFTAKQQAEAEENKEEQ